jgi:DNA-binding MarR family transcriptional regulator
MRYAVSMPDDLLDGLVQTSFAVTAVLSRVAAEHDLSLTQLRLIAILRDRQALRMSELATYLGLDRSTLSGLVDRAEARGLMARSPSASDGRATDVALTTEGHELAQRGQLAVAAALEPLTTRITAPDRRRLAALLQKLLAA